MLGLKLNHVSKMRPRGLNSKMSSYQHRKSHCGDKTISCPSYLQNGIFYAGKMTSVYWIRAQQIFPVHSAHLGTSVRPPLITTAIPEVTSQRHAARLFHKASPNFWSNVMEIHFYVEVRTHHQTMVCMPQMHVCQGKSYGQTHANYSNDASV